MSANAASIASIAKDPRSRRALVTGGSGTVGGAVVRALAARGVPTVFTWHRGEDRARALERATGARGVRLDLRDTAAIDAVGRELDGHADIFIHCAGVARVAPLAETTDVELTDALAVNVAGPLALVRALAPAMARAGGGDIVLAGGLDRGQAIPIPVAFAACQGALAAAAMALAKELGPVRIRVNVLALGILDAGLGQSLGPQVIADYRTFSALRRLGTPDEAARVAAWLALENGYLSGKVIAANGGI